MYVLVVSRLGNECRRYQSQPFETFSELKVFIESYKVYFETDGRHHIWIGTIDNSGLLIYDQHNVIFAYGQLDRYINILKKNGYKEKEFCFPAPHFHNFHQDNDLFEDRILNNYTWDDFPLGDGDEYE